jgi:cytokinesis protein
MDDLLAKLRAAKPEARDQRDRRRRARLKDRYQDRVASGQKMPELDELVKPRDDEGGDLLSPVKSDGGTSSAGSEVPPNSAGLTTEEDEDVADRAEKLLMGLGAEGEDDLSPVPRESIRMSRRRKEGAEDERSKRRRRRQLALSASEASLENQTHARASTDGSIKEELENGRPESGTGGEDDEEEGGETPKANGTIIVSPPSPTIMATPSKSTGILTPPGD